FELTGKVHDTVAYWLNGHGDMLANLGATAQADQAFQQAMAIYAEIEKPQGHFDRSVTLVGLGKVARDRGDLANAESLMREGLDIRERTIGEEHTFTQLARVDLADVLRRAGTFEEAREAFETALKVMSGSGDGEHPTAAQALTGLAQIELAESRFERAEQLLQQAIDMTAESIGTDHLDNVERRLILADVLSAHGDSAAAQTLRDENLEIRATILAEWQEALENARTPSQ
ncbi:MAG: tetratricopeptide repeat protein, partial [Pseudomonadota bacterium]